MLLLVEKCCVPHEVVDLFECLQGCFVMVNVCILCDSGNAYPWNENLSFLFFFMQQSLTILKIKTNFTAFILLQPMMIM